MGELVSVYTYEMRSGVEGVDDDGNSGPGSTLAKIDGEEIEEHRRSRTYISNIRRGISLGMSFMVLACSCGGFRMTERMAKYHSAADLN
jgi:hypothetical protein